MKKRQKHNYTSELELKCLLIRIKNKKYNTGTKKYNDIINKYVKWHTNIGNNKYDQDKIAKKSRIRKALKARAIVLSEQTLVNNSSYEKFGSIIMLMISKILSKPNFSGYTYRDDFYSDAIHKILKYLHNFNHKMISERTNALVNSFAYISQIIHNSIVYIINTKKKELINIQAQVSMEIVNHDLSVQDYNKNQSSKYYPDEVNDNNIIPSEFHIDKISNGLISEITTILEDDTFKNNETDYKIHIYIPEDYKISLLEYDEMKSFLKLNISILRTKKGYE